MRLTWLRYNWQIVLALLIAAGAYGYVQVLKADIRDTQVEAAEARNALTTYKNAQTALALEQQQKDAATKAKNADILAAVVVQNDAAIRKIKAYYENNATSLESIIGRLRNDIAARPASTRGGVTVPVPALEFTEADGLTDAAITQYFLGECAVLTRNYIDLYTTWMRYCEGGRCK